MAFPSVLDHAAIAALIPHAGSMCLLDSVTFWDAERIVCAVTSHRALDHPLRSNGRLGTAAGIEYAAQAMAVHGGLLASRMPSGKPPSGLLASARSVRLRVERLDDIEADLRVEARQLAADAHALAYAFELHADGRLLLEGRASVMLRAPGD